MFALLRRLAVAAALICPAFAAAQDFPPGWRELPQRPIVLRTGASLILRVAQSPRAGAFLLVSAPLAADQLAAGWQATLDRALGQAKVRQDLGVAPDQRGERRTRVVAGRIVAADGKPRAVLGEAQLVRTPAGGFIVGFLNAQDGADEPGVYEVAAQWVVAAAPGARVATPSAAPSGAKPLPGPADLPPVAASKSASRRRRRSRPPRRRRPRRPRAPIRGGASFLRPSARCG
ncbi:MAG: hypothetical protein IPL88_16015 [Rhizobiales bacterium]|nr:hypothetical protein [Hyphomicrobiales bacterium]